MSYCRWLEGHVYAYRAADGYVAHIGGDAPDGLAAEYREPTARRFLERMLWLSARGCIFPLEALEQLRREIVFEEDGLEGRADELLLRNVQIIDGAKNCTYPIFQCRADEFERLFPAGQDIAFIDEVIARTGEAATGEVLRRLWRRPIRKAEANGIHGTLFHDAADQKLHYPASRRECDLDDGSVNEAQREMNAIARARVNW